jgi:hypothetical protein
MISQSRLVVLAAIGTLSFAPPVFAQTHDWWGSPWPHINDGQGVRHYCQYGFYGPLVPPLVRADDRIIVCKRDARLSPLFEVPKLPAVAH